MKTTKNLSQRSHFLVVDLQITITKSIDQIFEEKL